MGLRKFFKGLLPSRMKQFFSVIPLFFKEATLVANNYRALSQEGYKKNPYVFASIREIAVAVSGIPWISRNAKGELLDTSDILKLIQRPNFMMAGPEFFQWWVSYYELAGDSFVLAVGPNNPTTPPSELFNVQPDMISFEKGKPFIGKGDKKKPVEPTRLLRMRMFNPLDVMQGLSPVEVGARSIVQSNESKNWNIAMLQNAAQPSGGFMTQGNLEEDQYNRLRDEIEEKIAGPKNARRPIIGEGGVEWQSFGLSPADMDWLEGQKLSAREIALTFGVPPELIGDATNKTYSNYREARRAFYEDTILPLMVMIRDKLNMWLMPLFNDGVELDFDTDQVSALQEDRALLFKRLQESDFLEINEKRDEAGFDETEGGDVVLVGLAQVPLASLSSGHRPEDEDKGAFCSKAFNMTTEELKDIYWKVFDRRRVRFTKSVRALVLQQITDDIAAAQKAIRGSSSTEAAQEASQAAVNANRPEWLKLFERIYLTVGQSFAEDTFAQLKSEGVIPETKEQKQDPQVEDFWLSEIQRWLTDNADLRVIGIQDATNRRILRSISDGVSEGLGINAIADSLRDLTGLGSITDTRAERIARTEVISASNLGSQVSAKSTGLPLEKEWIASRDGRVRGLQSDDKFSHSGLDGQRVPMEEPYIEPRSGEKLMFPGDISLGASGGNVIQCRCVEGYHVVGEE